jgi:hypothetical protein
LESNTYDVKCCKGFLINQGIGVIQGVAGPKGAFSDGYDDGFEITG